MNSDGFTAGTLGWLLSYGIHSTILLGAAWAFTRRRAVHPATADLIWKAALVGGVFTATIQSQLDLRPRGTIAIASAANVASTQRPLTSPSGLDNTAERSTVTTAPQPGAESDVPAARSGPGFATIAVIGWMVLALALALSYTARRLILVGRLGDRRSLGDGPLPAMLAAIARDAGHRGRICLTTSRTISSPVALGRAEICLPDAALTDLDIDQQRSMLAHEFAHLARRDPAWLAAAGVVERIFFFQPLNRVARREMQTAAEFLCDDWAARRTGSGVPLARCLAKVAEWIQASPLGVPVAGMAEQRSLLVSRIARLIERPAGAPRSRGGVALIGVALLGAMVLVAPRVAGRAPDELIDTTGDYDASGAGQIPGPAEHRGDANPVAQPVGNVRPDPAVGPDGRATTLDTTIVLALIARLRDEDAQVRRAAAQSLGRLEDPRAIPALLVTLKDDDAEVRSAAADAIGNFEDPRAIGPLTDLLADANADVKHNALSALSTFDKGVPSAPVIKLLDDADADVRHEAAHLLARLHDRAATGPLTKLLRDPDVNVRRSAIEALGELGDPAVAPSILVALTDPSADVRREALQALDNLKAPIPEATLLALLRDANANVRSSATQLVGERSIVAAVPALKRLLDDPSGDVRESAIDALSEIVDPSAREALRAALTSPDAKVRRRAVEALGERN